MKKTSQKSLFISSFALVSLYALIQNPVQAMEESSDEESTGTLLKIIKNDSDENLKNKRREQYDEWCKRMEQLSISKEKRVKKRNDEFEALLTSVGCSTFSNLYDVFKTLEKAATKAGSNGKHAEAAKLWEGMVFYADAIVDSTSKFYNQYGPILDFGSVVSAEQKKQKEIGNRKTMGFKGATESYFNANDYSKSGEMWDQLKQYKSKAYESFTIDEAKKAALAYRFAENLEKEIEYRSLAIETDDDRLDFAELLWELKPIELYYDSPENYCGGVMLKAKGTNSATYYRAYALLKENDPELLELLMNPQENEVLEGS